MISNLKSIEENQEYLKSVIGIDGRNRIDWKNSVGKEIEYEYDWKGEYSNGTFKIVKYDTKNGKIYFEEYEKGICRDDLTRCRLGSLLNFKSLDFKYEIGVSMNHLTIINREYRYDKKDRKRKYYKYNCNKCGNEDWIEESNLKRGKGCNACCPSPRKVVLEKSIWYKERWMMELGVTEDDAKTHTPSSSEKIEVKCPHCGKIKKITPNKIFQRHSIGCSCGDGISYPEKIMENVLIQLDIKYKWQYKPNWSQNKKYDFYLLDTNAIIEVHGVQHYEESNRGRSLKEEQENDEFKKELALKNGTKNYIVIDCSKSELKYIKNNIIDSKLNELFDLSNINWNKCEEYALKNKVKEICDYYNEHQEISTTDLTKEFGMCKSTIIKYLKQGTELGWCKYDAKEARGHGLKLGSKSTCKPVSQFTIEGSFIKTYSSASEAERQMGIPNSSISFCCNGKYKTAGGYVWKFVE